MINYEVTFRNGKSIALSQKEFDDLVKAMNSNTSKIQVFNEQGEYNYLLINIEELVSISEAI